MLARSFTDPNGKSSSSQTLRGYLETNPFSDTKIFGFHDWLVRTTINRKLLGDLIALREWGLTGAHVWRNGSDLGLPVLPKAEFSDELGLKIIEELVDNWKLNETLLVCDETDQCRCALCAPV